jgi:sorbitol/mannitol transport system substrate-binding protein
MAMLRGRAVCAATAVIAVGSLLAACGGSSNGSTDDKSINVLMANNPQMIELQKLTAQHFTKDTGIHVRFTALPENETRDKVSQDFSKKHGQYDVASISNYEAPIYARKGWLQPLDKYISKGGTNDQEDVLLNLQLSLTGSDGKIYGQPFYGESSFMMYRKDVFERLGLKMPEKPTWPQIQALAEKTDGAEKGMKGICLRGLPGWGEMIAPLTTVVNTFGGTWFDKNWNARLTDPAFEKAADFYVDLVRKHGEKDAAQAGFAECSKDMLQGKSAMWYDATSGAGALEGSQSKVKGKIGYVQAPTLKTKNSGWLYTWAWGLRKHTDAGNSAWKFIKWASSKDFERLVGKEYGWSNVPAGKRKSTFDNPEYEKAAKPFYKPTEEAIRTSDPRSPGVQRRPAPGIQFVGVPEFTTLANQVSQQLSEAINGQQSVDDALKKSQQLAQKVGDKYKKR